MPGLEEITNAFAFDQRAGENRAEKRRTRAWLETLDIDPTRKVKKLFLWGAAFAKSVGGFFRKHEQERGQIVFFDRPFGPKHEVIFPTTQRSALFGGAWLSPRGDALGKIPMPGRNFYNRSNSHTLRNAQRFQAIPRPAVKQIETSGRELTGCDPIEVFFLGAVIIRSIQRGEQSHWVPA